jgi:hypothetical protein
MRGTIYLILVLGETDTLWIDLNGILILEKIWHS